MNIPWENHFCILCLEDRPLSFEHLIPASIGGKLTAGFLCKECNSDLGAEIEANIRFSPEIRMAILCLKKELPKLYDSIEAGQEYKTEIDGEVFSQRLGRHDRLLGEQKLTDGSLIVPEERAQGHLQKMLERSGENNEVIKAALSCWENVPYGERIDLPGGLVVKKWEQVPSAPKLANCSVSALVILKIVYEFIALLIGSAIIAKSPDFEVIRKILLEKDAKGAQYLVLKLEAAEYRPFHGICFEGNDPTASFQVRLFGKLAYRVALPKTALNVPPVAYTFIMGLNEHDFRYTKRDK